MAVKKKGKRSIIIEDEEYIWFIRQEGCFFAPPGPGYQVKIIKLDKSLIFSYQLGQPKETSHVTIEKSHDITLQPNGINKRYLCPVFGSSTSFKPSDVKNLIDWLLTENQKFIEVNYLGLKIENENPNLKAD